MKQRLLKTIALALTVLGGVGSVWAEDFTPTLDVSFRTNSTNNGWQDSNYPKVASESNNVFECNAKNGMFVLQKYTVDNLARVKKLTLTLTNGSGSDALAIWAFGNTTWTAVTSASDIVSAYTTAVGIAPRATEGENTTTYLLKDQKSSVSSGVSTYVIEGTALTTLRNAASENTFTLLITNTTTALKTDTKREICSSGHATEANRPKLTAEYYVYNATTSTDYETLNAAVDATASVSTDTELQLFDDIALTSRVTYSNTNGKTLTITPMKNITITAGNTNFVWFLINKGSNAALNIGKNTNTITLDGNSNTYSVDITKRENGGSLTLTNVNFKNFTMASEKYLCNTNNQGGTMTLDGVTFDGCSTSAIAFINSNRDANGTLILKGHLNQTNCTGTTIYTLYKDASNRGRIQVSDDSFTASKVITIKYGKTSASPLVLGGGPLVVGISNVANAAQIFDIDEEEWGLYKNNGDLKITQGYKLDVNFYRASTLVLPFESTIPTGATCYTLNYTAGKSSVKATQVTTTLSANTPVLVNANEGNYKFVSTATSGDAATGSGTHTSGALTGVYSSTDVPSSSYILWANENNPIGFYKANSSTVAANRAYMTADGAGARIVIIYDETTGIDNAKTVTEQDGTWYDLSGRKLENRPAVKGIFINNGKKYIVK